YWEKPVWILPIHHQSNGGHWVLCTIMLLVKQLPIFDSLAKEKPWRDGIKVGDL
ncbi:hypothetical protein EDC04DRAFT_2552595, partial [Pisolithus marmoratus]